MLTSLLIRFINSVNLCWWKVPNLLWHVFNSCVRYLPIARNSTGLISSNIEIVAGEVFEYVLEPGGPAGVKIGTKSMANLWKQGTHPSTSPLICLALHWNSFRATWAPSQYPKRRLFVRSREVSKPRDLYLELSDRSEIWQALRQHCCRCACQISKGYDNLKYHSRGFETLRDLTKRRLFGYWDGALDQCMTEKLYKRL